MAQSFNAITPSLGEAERERNGKSWDTKDYKNHQQHGYKIDPSRSDLNVVFVSANGQSERDLVNNFLLDRMEKLNAEKVQAVKDWNTAHASKIGKPKLDKNGNVRMNKKGEPMLVHKKSVDKRELFPVGEWAGKGKRSMPFDTFKSAIEVGNLRGKEGTTRYRNNVLQQYVVGLGNDAEWQGDPVRAVYLKTINGSDKAAAKVARDELNKRYFQPELERFEKENPSLHVVQAVVHYDESHPHMQFSVMPWVDGKENGGLGSTSFGGAIKHDHDGMNITNWYQQEHEKLRDLIQSADSGFVQMKTGKPVKMALDPKRPGSHASTRVDVHDRMMKDLQKQAQWLQSQAASTKEEAIATLKGVKPDHMVPASRLPKGVKPAKISTTEGEDQHRAQPLAWLLEVLQRAIQSATERAMLLMQTVDERKAKAEEAESKAELANAALSQHQFVRDAELEVAQRESFEQGRLYGRQEHADEWAQQAREVDEDYAKGMDSDPAKQEGYEEMQQDAAAADGGEADTVQGRNRRNIRTRQENRETSTPHKIDYGKLARSMPVGDTTKQKPTTPKPKDDGLDL